jgi:D-glycero-alpha-D-manno-heptose-7-phosphate kinase
VERAVIRAGAPLRLDFAGGWTDVPPFVDREGGVVVNAAIGLTVEAEFEPGLSGHLLIAEDLNLAARVNHPADLAPTGILDLHKAALRMFPCGPGTLRTRSKVPPGSGLGSSGALDVALVRVLTWARGEEPTPEEIAAEGWHLEAVEAGIPGGRQDQYAAALGGFHRFTFRGEAVGVEPLSLDPAFLADLERRTVICYTGRSRVSGDTIARVMRAYEEQDSSVRGALMEMKAIADEMTTALRRGDLARTGELLSANWGCQQRLDPGMKTVEMAALEAAMVEAGALGGKAAGAGAGGSMFFVMGRDPGLGLEAARRAGAEVLPGGWSLSGVARC